MNLSYKNRIAIYYMLATASIIAMVFIIVYFVVQTAVYRELDSDLAYEAHKHTKEIHIVRDSILFINKNEWREREHREVQVNPVFVQIVNEFGKLMDKSPNLKEGFLVFHTDRSSNTHFDTKLNNKAIRQVQIPIELNGVKKGYIITAMSQEGAIVVLDRLKTTLIVLFPIILIGLFFITRFIAGRSIVPVQVITQTTDRITRKNLNKRITLPANKDELYSLTSSINELLDRIQNAMEREKQFTADASHQLRTPLAVIKGTLEVLIRKPRAEEEYREKIQFSIKEIDRISAIVNQLLTLARFDKDKPKLAFKEVDLSVLVDDILDRFKKSIQQKNLSINLNAGGQSSIYSDSYHVDLILDNIISNAIKYSPPRGIIDVTITHNDQYLICKINDEGSGIPPDDLKNIFNPFFRSDRINNKKINGNGLGLSIVQKAANGINAKIDVESALGQGSKFTVSFSKNLHKANIGTSNATG